jgi:hypothetical protein
MIKMSDIHSIPAPHSFEQKVRNWVDGFDELVGGYNRGFKECLHQ